METRRPSTVLRILAPLALIIAGVALVMIVTASNGSGGGDKGKSERAAEKQRDLGTASDGEDKTPRKKRNSDRLPQKYYIVKTGDTLGAIAEKTGVPVEKLQTLNEGLDQFSLRSGQKIKLR